MFSIIVSKQDTAGMNFKKLFLENFGFKETEREFDGNKVFEKENFELVTINKLQIFADYVDKLETDFLIFASRHSSKSERPTLTVHPIGNWGNKAEFGGKPRTLVPTSANLLKNYLVELQNQRDERQLSYEVSFEVSHHGAFLSKPTVYIELGSSEKQWNDLKAAESICETILRATTLRGSNNVAVGLGGQHYNAEFSKLVLRKDFALSHMCPKYVLEFFDEEMLQKAIDATLEEVESIVFDEKGLGREKTRLMDLLKSHDFRLESVRKLLKN